MLYDSSRRSVLRLALPVVTRRRNSWACIGNPNPEQETIKGTCSAALRILPLADGLSSAETQQIEPCDGQIQVFVCLQNQLSVLCAGGTGPTVASPLGLHAMHLSGVSESYHRAALPPCAAWTPSMQRILNEYCDGRRIACHKQAVWDESMSLHKPMDRLL